MKKIKIAIITGTRPELIKVSVLLKIIEKDSECELIFIHSGQHYDEQMFSNFLSELNLPVPNYNIAVGSLPNSVQTGKMLISLYEVIVEKKPDIILAQGDTNTVVAAALTAFKNSIPFGHIEAGIRSFDFRMPEEINRMITGSCSLLNFAPTKLSVQNLINEGVNPKRIFCVGNTVVDAVMENLKIANDISSIMQEINLSENERFILLTAHRPSNVDNETSLNQIFQVLIKHPKIKFIFPAHPRTKKKLVEINLWKKLNLAKNVILLEPIKYFDMLKLLSLSYFIITDSGGLQEEAVILKKPCITLRNNTERPESVQIGANILVGNDPTKIEFHLTKLWEDEDFYESMVAKTNPFGDGTSSKQIIKIIKQKFESNELKIPFIDFGDKIPHIKLNIINEENQFIDTTIGQYEEKERCSVLELFDQNGLIQFPASDLTIQGGMSLKVRYI